MEVTNLAGHLQAKIDRREVLLHNPDACTGFAQSSPGIVARQCRLPTPIIDDKNC